MSENSTSAEHNGHERDKDDDDTNAITMVDVLEEENELEEDATAVLGGSDPLNCTYPVGFVKRQALYACLTCIPPQKDSRPGGICLACSYSCHEGHDLVELYTKRNFRCDCGSDAFGGNKCNLNPVKEVNEKNAYNQNFRGLYCTCKRPYPDPENKSEDGMIQCNICEDWYHGQHLGAAAIPSEYGEMICGSCMADHPFLWKYSELCINHPAGTPVDIGGSPQRSNGSHSSINSATPGTPALESVENSPFKSVETASSSHQDQGCRLKNCKSTETWKGATFWPEEWRKQLCVCSDCEKTYANEGVEYITDLQDTVQYYEQQGKEKAANGAGGSQYDRAMQALSKMDRVQQVEAIHGYNDMKDQLIDYLKKFAKNGKVVREEDIREFFSGFARKRQRTDIPSFCR